jgi:deazaflavin-dependent oxidoreductase (nitroreductase family)
VNVQDLARRKTVRLTTRGRKTGEPRTAVIWFVTDGPNRMLVQHAAGAAPNWYRNLVKHPDVTLDFGDGPIAARATPIRDPGRVREVLALIRRKYWAAWVIQLLGRRSTPVAAEISWAGTGREE